MRRAFAKNNVRRRVALSLGANLGKRAENLIGAIASIEAFLGPCHKSSIYESISLYDSGQPAYLNMVMEADLSVDFSDPMSLLAELQGIEARFGRDRVKEGPKGARSLDIDIIDWTGPAIESPSLVLPHPAWLERAFVLLPLIELRLTLREFWGLEYISRKAVTLSSQVVHLAWDSRGVLAAKAIFD